ncbi:unnamed protein product [Psylliodes chrysocephalus]|uniref:Uncharacterized protein n=1 Tax=Psylliodes chrysocephalus TaxID=3402493 RepID=A0A9P0GID2_9CUCU|nr:unnamed protein product [Psylliodes chrysocephala]
MPLLVTKRNHGNILYSIFREKLWSRFVNVKAALQLAQQNKAINQVLVNPVIHIDEGIKNDLIFLKSAIEPYHKMLSARTDKTEPIEKIFEDFPCLKKHYRAELFESDFNITYPEQIDIIYNEWPKVSEAILKEADDRKISCPVETTLGK